LGSDRNGNSEIYLMDLDGKLAINLTQNAASDTYPVWSPDGTQIAFATDRDDITYEIYVMNGDGSNSFNLTQHTSTDQFPVWSEDGTRVTFSSLRTGAQEFYEVRLNGSNLRQLSFQEYLEYYGAHSHNGDLAYVSDSESPYMEIYVRDASSDIRRITYNNVADVQPDWSPQGDRIAFVSAPTGAPNIFVMNADGSDLRQITHNNFTLSYAPKWRPCY
jgi:Tol biopolymer transport system component